MAREQMPSNPVSRRTTLGGIGAAIGVGLAGCSGDGGDAGSETDELVATLATDLESFDPTQHDSVAYDLLYEGLTATDFQGQVQNVLAESIAVDGTSVDVTLREGVTFHNGSTLTASDVKASYERYEGSPRESDVYDWYESAEVVSETELSITLSQEYAPLERALSISVVPEEVADGEIDISTNPIGTGPYQYDTYESGDMYRITRFDDYWFSGSDAVPSPPPVETITFQIIPEQSSQQSALESGDVDMISSPPAGSVGSLESNDQYTVNRETAGGFDMVIYPMHEAADTPFQNRKVRRGVSRLIPREAIINSVFDGVGTPAYAPVSPLARQYTSESFQQEMAENYVGYDPERATTLLEEGFQEAGYSRPFSSRILTDQNPQRVDWVLLLQESLNDTGFFDITVEQFEFNTLLSQIMGPESFQKNAIPCLGWSGGWDPDAYVNVLFNEGKFTPGCCNVNHYSDPRVNELINEGLTTYDPEERAGIYEEAQRRIVEDSPIGFVRFSEVIQVYDNDTIQEYDTYPIPEDLYNGIYAPYGDTHARL